MLEGHIGASVTLRHRVALSASIEGTRHSGCQQQRYWAGVLAGNKISAWALGHHAL